ncbi:molybdate ABC transporter substrate-binding protein [Sphingomonas quercus]|uniref:Molybdate ABC transporter substrate-binding protein n=1 Tax=Sphingomonas quercus TaxID=2842451 RepID=A0ABS6BLP8_9SPHN|nr:molybdate ABC transporter substrate-binding protein [Sphingomonas quercus]MBU3079231.1 molybdate ABC transporter substrate-binding protein [Sphingomonas quercus]
MVRLLALWLALLATPALTAPPIVLAAASLQESLTEAAGAWAKAGHAMPVLSFGASSALARQIRAGAPADLFFSADEDWMDAVEQSGELRPGTRADLLGNRLALIVPAGDRRRFTLDRRLPLARLLGNGRLAMADPDAVPAGKYGKAALAALGLWPDVANRIARGESVRTALAFVERGEAPFGIVYETDAMASSSVRVAAIFPAGSHKPIRYPVALLKRSASPDAAGFRRFLASPAASAIFRRHGFGPL